MLSCFPVALQLHSWVVTRNILTYMQMLIKTVAPQSCTCYTWQWVPRMHMANHTQWVQYSTMGQTIILREMHRCTYVCVYTARRTYWKCEVYTENCQYTIQSDAHIFDTIECCVHFCLCTAQERHTTRKDPHTYVPAQLCTTTTANNRQGCVCMSIAQWSITTDLWHTRGRGESCACMIFLNNLTVHTLSVI